ncbi:MAG: hypothetical protein CMI02_07505 [Oceanospirillaceae bacterium]|nr:hypothetical protein [Oceanospirillaceae bacterium]|tara:strand:- start:2 stop:289 length:288 start_codon:yes stop_codon:yes gene_type:complete
MEAAMNTACGGIKESSELQQLVGRVSDNSPLVEFNSRLSRLVDLLDGARSDKESGEAPEPVANGLLLQLERDGDRRAELLSKMHDKLARLELIIG